MKLSEYPIVDINELMPSSKHTNKKNPFKVAIISKILLLILNVIKLEIFTPDVYQVYSYYDKQNYKHSMQMVLICSSLIKPIN